MKIIQIAMDDDALIGLGDDGAVYTHAYDKEMVADEKRPGYQMWTGKYINHRWKLLIQSPINVPSKEESL